MPALIIGGDGLIGGALARHLFELGEDPIRTTRRFAGNRDLHLDLTDFAPDWQPPDGTETAFFCAAATRLADCRQHPDRTRTINVEAPARLATQLAGDGVFCLFLSTTQVFDGTRPMVTADTPPNPISAYGRQKAEAEARFLALGDNAAVLRLAKVIGPGDGLLAGWCSTLQSGQPVTAFSDLTMAPIALDLALIAMHQIAAARRPGLFQLSATADITYVDAARHLARRLGAAPELVRSTTSAAAGIDLEHLPSHASLDGRRLAQECGIAAPGPLEALDLIFDSAATAT